MKPEPLTPPDLDLRDFEWMPLKVVRLRDSGIVVVASAEAFRAAVLLWCAAWHQVPAASLPKDEKMLCSLAGFGRDLKTWRSLAAEALHGFVECSDGRLYHPVIAEAAIESGSKKKKQGKQTAAATEAARLARLARDAERNGDRNGLRNGDAEPDRNGLQGRGEDRNGEDKTLPDQKESEHTDSARDFFEEFWKAYPERDGDNPKLPAKLKFDALVKTGVDPELMIAGAKRYADKAREKQQIGTQYIAHALKWLSEQRWADIAAVSYIASERADAPMNWELTVKLWLKNESIWPRNVGGVPGSTTCRCPDDVLIAAGVDPNSGRPIAKLFPIYAQTDEMAALLADCQARKARPPKVFTIEDEGREKTLCWAETRWPKGFNDFGERIDPTSEEHAA